MPNDKNSDVPIKNIILWGIILLIIVLIYALIVALSAWLVPGITLGNTGTFGDSFGLLTSLFSGLAFLGLILTIIQQNKAINLQREDIKSQTEQLSLQKNELSLQREELKLTREELNRSANAQENSEKALKDQSDILKKTLVYQSFDSLTKEYREAHMLQGVRRLWDFYRDVGEDALVNKYIEKMKIDNIQIDNANDEDKIKVQQGTLHFQRRNISQFYSRIATFINEGIIPEDIFYSSWGETDLQIIPKILIPVENGIRRETIGEQLPDFDDDSQLMQLYLKSKNYNNIA